MRGYNQAVNLFIPSPQPSPGGRRDSLKKLPANRVSGEEQPGAGQRLHHIGFFIASENEVDDWYVFLKDNGVEIKAAPKTHRDGARSFYCSDPEGTTVQIIFHPPIK